MKTKLSVPYYQYHCVQYIGNFRAISLLREPHPTDLTDASFGVYP